ncbi:hypothetical protein P8825_14950 [Shouchella clausii]|uniref:hypothetical protein n=1 Tax=Shouchella clausii TaxID=79880 RepID=UPI002DBF89D6|nr:hypothetical protein [Shouchella clausii]MEB5480862.1 hypothetical protein [Shouchella clausii]
MNLTLEQAKERALTCQSCGKITEHPYGFDLKYLKGLKNASACFDCADKYFESVKSKYLVEQYGGYDIYCVDGRYFPFWDSFYHLESLEACKNRIDKSNLVTNKASN